MAYATTTELSTYTGIPESDLPDDSDRLLERASDIIDYLVKIDYTESDYTDELRDATCAQVEYWLSMGEEIDYTQFPHNFSIGSFSMGSGTGNQNINPYAPRMYRILLSAGLLYSGRGLK